MTSRAELVAQAQREDVISKKLDSRFVVRVMLLGGVFGPVCFAAAVLIGSALRPGYDDRMQVMSVLGESGSANAMLMNGLGFQVTGLLIMAFAFALHQVAPRSLWSIVGGMLLAVFGGGIISAGIYSCDPGCLGTGTSRDAFLHIVASAIAFTSGILACFVWGAAFRRDSAWRSLTIFSWLAGLLAAWLLFAFNSTSGTDSSPGLWQSLFIGSLFGWCAVVGIYSFRLAASASTVTNATE